MAEAFVQILLDNLNSLIHGEIGLIMSVNAEMEKLKSNLTAIQAVLEDAEEQQLKSHATRNWLCKLNDLTYEIDDILDECSTEAAKLQNKNSNYFPSKLKNILYRRKIGRRMKAVMEKLNVVAEERSKLHLREIAFEKQSKFIAARETGSVLNYSEPVYGRNDEKTKIVNILVNQVRDCQQLSVVPIVGIGGLGKTTLAQLVFNDPRVAEHFGIKIWVCVSDNFDLKTLIKAMIESITRSPSNLETLDTLQRHLCELLNQNRYLLVLDDVWNEDQESWFKLKNVLACGSSGASIILTTRVKKIADMMSTFPAHELTGLSTKDCWLLFKQRAFGQDEEQYPNLEAIGDHIVENKCVGVPLAAKTLGGLLRFKRNEKEWMYVKESKIWDLPQEETPILPVLRLSYHHLPLTLRQCFAYCAVFPKDYVMNKEEVIRLWIAHGYISSNHSEVEDVGDGIWNELVLRSLFQDVDTSYYGITFKMHDLVHDLAQSILENKVSGVQAGSNTVGSCTNKIREVNMGKRSMAFPTNSLPNMDLSSVIKEFSNLRSLKAGFFQVSHLASTVGNLLHLRYLNLSQNQFRTLPDTICSLWNLKILNLNRCINLVRLPKHMRRMHNLRHVYLEYCWSLSEMPPKIGELTYLRTWSVFIVGHEKGNHLEELQRWNLGGTLQIKHLGRVKSHIDAKKANLVGKQNLRKLTLEWEKEIPANLGEKEYEKIIGGLEPHPNLEELRIWGFKGKQFPIWMGNSTLENIVCLNIENCRNCLHLPQGLGDLPSLKTLFLKGVGLEYIIENDVAVVKPKFPSLEILKLHVLPNLKGLLKEETGRFLPNLRSLTIEKCFLLEIPHLPSLKGLELRRCSSVNVVAWIPKLRNLERLDVLSYEEGVDDFPFENLHNLTFFTFQSLTKLKCLGEGLQFLTSLQYLILYSLPELISLPDGLGKCTSLLHLNIQNCPKLHSLPDGLGKCTSLSSLSIHNCPKLESFPDSIKELRNLKIEIFYCPELEKWCEKKKEEGDDWYKWCEKKEEEGDDWYKIVRINK